MATFPNVGLTSFNMRLKSAVSVSTSPFTYTQQVYQHPGVIWEAEITLPALNRSEAKQVEGFLAGLRGSSGTFTMAHPLHTSTANGTITGAVGDTSITVNMSASASVGDYFSHSGHIYIITEKTSATNYQIMPPLRDAAATSTVDFTYPEGTWRLASNEVNWSTDVAGIYGFSLAIVEAL